MFILGHVGISVGVVHAISRRADLRWVPVFALLPDLIDKPLGLALPALAHGWSRTIGHSLFGLALFSLAAVAFARRRAWIAIVPYALHLVLDRMWRERDYPALFWPFTGVAMPPHEPPYLHWWERFEEQWQYGGELVGLSILVALVVHARLWRPEAWRHFVATGELSGATSISSPGPESRG